MDKKIAIIGTVGLPAKYGGFETLTEYLTKHLGDDFDFTVFCSSKSYNEKILSHNNARLKYIPFEANGIQSIIYDFVSIGKAICFADTLLILGVSGCIALPLVKLISSKKIVVNIDGLEWKRAKWNKLAKWFLKFSETLAIKYSDQVITDNKAIQDYVIEEYGEESVLIEYGGDHVQKQPLSIEMKETYPLSRNPYAFTVCRIEPENNIHLILEAFSKVKFPLIMIGNFKNSEYGKSLVKSFSDRENIQLCDPVYDQGKLDQLRSNAALYVHGHSAGGTNPSLVEAMCLGLPVVAFDVGYNRETTLNQALYFTKPKDLVSLIVNRQEDFNELRVKMKKIGMSRYNWCKITQKYADILINAGSQKLQSEDN